MLDTLKGLIASKKAVAMIVGAVMAYVIGQGIADHGKEAVKAKA